MLLLTGPPGCGKTATLQILARDLGLQVQEWTNPLSLDFTKEDLRNMFGHGKYVGVFSFLSFFLLPVTSVGFLSCIFASFLCHIRNQIHIHISTHPCKSIPKCLMRIFLLIFSGKGFRFFYSV